MKVELIREVGREEVWDRGKIAEGLWELLDTIFYLPAYALAYRFRTFRICLDRTITVKVDALVNSSNETIDDFQ